MCSFYLFSFNSFKNHFIAKNNESRSITNVMIIHSKCKVTRARNPGSFFPGCISENQQIYMINRVLDLEMGGNRDTVKERGIPEKF